MQAKLVLKEISKNFHGNKDKYSVHRKLTAHFEQLCQDKNFLHDAIRDCLSKKNFFNNANNLFFYLLIEGDVIIAINLFPPIYDKTKDITVDNIHHHGWRLLTTGVISGNGYESINFKRKSHEDIEAGKVKIKIDKIFKHDNSCCQFIDSEQPHVVFHPETTTATLAIWSADRDLINQKFKNVIKNFPKTIKFTSNIIHQIKLDKIFGLNKKNNVHYIPKNKEIIFDPNPPKKNDGNTIEITNCILKFLQQVGFNDYSFLKKLQKTIPTECQFIYDKLVSGETIPDIGIIGHNNRRFTKKEILESIKN
jgi:hypothetical protein